MSQPLVSVLLTVYNRESVINTIDSILKQTYSNFEFIIVDNCSTDNTCKVINKIQDNRIKLYINDKNYGQTYSLKRGITLCSGEYIARIDADDIALPTRLEKQVDFLEKNTDYGFCGSWLQYITNNNELTFKMCMPITDIGLRHLQRITCGMFHPTVMMRRSVLVENNITYDDDIKISEDYELWRKLLLSSKGLNLPEVLLYYRRGENDSVKYVDTLHYEAQLIRKKLNEYEYKDYPQLKAIADDLISMEAKEKKSLFGVLKIFHYTKKLLAISNVENKTDKHLLKVYGIMHVYTFGFFYNKMFWARILNKIYRTIKDYKTLHGKKANI